MSQIIEAISSRAAQIADDHFGRGMTLDEAVSTAQTIDATLDVAAVRELLMAAHRDGSVIRLGLWTRPVGTYTGQVALIRRSEIWGSSPSHDESFGSVRVACN